MAAVSAHWLPHTFDITWLITGRDIHTVAISLVHANVDPTIYVEASNRNITARNISSLTAVLYGCALDDVSFYNLDSYLELIDEKGVGEVLDFRLFESSRNAAVVVSWVENPLFLAPLN